MKENYLKLVGKVTSILAVILGLFGVYANLMKEFRPGMAAFFLAITILFLSIYFTIKNE